MWQGKADGGLPTYTLWTYRDTPRGQGKVHRPTSHPHRRSLQETTFEKIKTSLVGNANQGTGIEAAARGPKGRSGDEHAHWAEAVGNLALLMPYSIRVALKSAGADWHSDIAHATCFTSEGPT